MSLTESSTRPKKHSGTDSSNRRHHYSVSESGRKKGKKSRHHDKGASIQKKHEHKQDFGEKPKASDMEEKLREKLLKRVEKREKRRLSESDPHQSCSPEKASEVQRRRSPSPRKKDDRHRRERSPEEGRQRRKRSRSPSPTHSRRHDRRRYGDQTDRRRLVSRGGYERPSRKHPLDPVPLHLNRKVQRHAEEIQKRKLLWQKSAESKKPSTNWNSLLAASGADDKSAEKFRKMMGIKESAAVDTDTKETGEQRQKQAQLFHNLDVQYQTARLTTHLQKGVGLGFSSQKYELLQRPVPAQPPDSVGM